MDNYGFYISKLVLQGADKEDAAVDFKPGLNVISGASNTGKTFILQCIDFVFGAGTKPKSIPESNGYHFVFLELRTHSDDRVITLMRDLREPVKLLQTNSVFEEFWKLNESKDVNILNSKVTKDKDTVSNLLLHLSGFTSKEEIHTNSDNKKRKLSFRDISHLTVIDEETIIEEKSPIFHGEYAARTAEAAVFRLLVTGEDSTDLLELPDTSKRKMGIKAQLQLIEDMTRDLSEKIALGTKEEKESNSNLDEEIKKINGQYVEIEKTLAGKLKERKELWNNLESNKNRLLSIQELIVRFKILESQYRSDLERLEFLVDGEYLISQLQTVDCLCPVCGSAITPDTQIHQHSKEAIKAEAEKIARNYKELGITIQVNTAEQKKIQQELREIEGKYSNCENEIKKNIEPYRNSIQVELQGLVMKQKKFVALNGWRNQLVTFSEKKKDLEHELESFSKSLASKGEINKEKLQDFIDSVKSLLVSWKYLAPDAFVDFNSDRENFDIVIDAVDRASNGKGVRALLYSAFILGLMRHAHRHKLPHPLIVVLDTPLHSFKEEDSGISDKLAVKNIIDAFFRDLSALPRDTQVIVLENEEPSSDLIKKFNYQYFTGNKQYGRAAFIPPPKKKLK